MKGFLILVVDDDPDICEDIGELLADEGYGVHAAADGREALEMVASAPPAVFLADVDMPQGRRGRAGPPAPPPGELHAGGPDQRPR